MCVLTLSVLICGLSGCGNEPLPTESKPPEKPHFENSLNQQKDRMGLLQLVNRFLTQRGTLYLDVFAIGCGTF